MITLKYGQRVKVTSGFYEGMTGEVTEVGNLIRVQNEMGNVLEPESSLEIIN